MTTRTLTRRAPPPTRLKVVSILGDAIAIAVGLSSSFIVHLGGDLPISEILMSLLLPVLVILRGPRLLRPRLKTVFSLMGLGLFGLLMTDIYRGTQTQDWLRGDAAIVFFAIDLIGIAVLMGKNERRTIIFLTAFAIGSLLATRFQPSDYASADPWKFGYSTGTILLVVLVSSYFFGRRQYAIAALLLAGIMGVNLLFDFRSQVLFLLITAVMVLPVIPEQIGRLRILPRAGSAGRVAVLAGLALAAGGSAYGIVHLASSSGLLGDAAQAKDETQARSRGGVLLGGRPEIQVSTRAVWDSPILGHGSWARDMKYVEMLHDIQAEDGIPVDLQDAEAGRQGLIPSHSHLMGAWVSGGILGAFLWCYLVFLALKAIVRVTVLRPANAPIYALMLVEFLWNIAFSPFGSTARMSEAVLIVIIVNLLDSAPQAVRAIKGSRFSTWRRRPSRERAFPSPWSARNQRSSGSRNALAD